MHYPQGPLDRGMQLTTREDPLRQNFCMIHKAFALKGESSLFVACGETRGREKPKAVIVLLRLRGESKISITLATPYQYLSNSLPRRGLDENQMYDV